MITVGLIKEVHFIACIFGRPVLLDFRLGADTQSLNIEVNEDNLFIRYAGQEIWKERLSGADSGFGIESCDNISRIIACLDAGDDSWKTKYKYIEQ